MLTIAKLAEQFPIRERRTTQPGCISKPVTGWIPYAFYEAHLAEIKAARKAHPSKTRAYYRGPRAWTGASTTAVKNARSVVIYAEGR